jgi:hypothetical protein
MSFGALLEAALAGTLRQVPPSSLPAFDDLTPEGRLLRSASYEGLRRLAGRPVASARDTAAVEPCEPETQAEINSRAATRVPEILAERTELLGEWLNLVAARHRRVPHMYLPDLLELARFRPDVLDLVVQVGGERLAWLARLNPDWQFGAAAEPDEQFTLGTRDQRVAALTRIRRQDPARARQLLQETWTTESGDMRATLLNVLSEGLSTEDETLIEQALGDSRKEVRETALRWIRRIPGSRFSARWRDRARHVVQFKKRLTGSRVEVREPREADPTWLADGLDPRPPKGIGETAWLLQQVMALTPPSIWPQETLVAFQKSDWGQPLLVGLSQAAAAYADAEWCEELLMHWATLSKHQNKNTPRLFAALPPDRAEAVVLRVLETDPEVVTTLATRWQHAWSEDFSRAMVRRLPELLGKWQHVATWFVREALVHIDPSVLPELEHLLEAHIEPIWLRAALERLAQRMAYRQAMRLELDQA